MGIWVLSGLQLWWINLPWTLEWKSLCGHDVSFLDLDEYLGVGLLGHILSVCFWDTAILFSEVVVPFFISTGNVCELPLHSFTSLASWATFVGVQWNLIVVLTYTSLITNDVQHLFMFLMAIVWLLWSTCLYLYHVSCFLYVEMRCESRDSESVDWLSLEGAVQEKWNI